MAIEAKPAVQWNKGEAALHILRQEFGNDWSEKVKVIFAGDDTTDEDAMKVWFFFSLWAEIAHRIVREINEIFPFTGAERCWYEFSCVGET